MCVPYFLLPARGGGSRMPPVNGPRTFRAGRRPSSWEDEMRNVLLLGVVLIAGSMVLSGCAKEPAVEIAAARQALTQAETPDVTEYAAQSLAAAREAVKAMDAELTTQKGKFVLFRKYDQAKVLCAAAKTSAGKAVTDGAAGKARAKNEASDVINQAKAAVAETRTLLASAPRGKGASTDIAALESDLAGVDAVIAEAEGLFGQERYIPAKAKASAARMDAERTKSVITAAIDAYNQARGRKR